jgi:hypothetical protein
VLKLCVFFINCASYLPIPLTQESTVGLGRGGTATFQGFETPGIFKVSIEGAPWTIGVASVTSVQTASGTGTVTAQGWVFGPVSPSTAANVSGVVQLVSAACLTFANADLLTGDHALITTLKLHFVPEAGQLLLLGCGGAALLLVGRGRMRR